MSEDRVKILVVGPARSGKTCVANYLTGTRDTPTVDYKETSPLRILETVIEGINVGGGGRRQMGRGRNVAVEVWDVGGSPKFQNCWPAIRERADGIIFVINPEIRNQEKELELWHKSFAAPRELPDKHCLIFCHHSTSPEIAVGANAIPQMPQSLAGIRPMETSLDFQSDNFKEAFEKLVETVLLSRREAEENAVLRNEQMSGPLLVGSSRQEF